MPFPTKKPESEIGLWKKDNAAYHRERRAKEKLSPESLPHQNKKLYAWQREFLECDNKQQFITAANQVGKSTINILKAIRWATEKTLWPKLWRSEPRQFWYLYPDFKTIHRQVENHWIPECLPRGTFKNHNRYGWELISENGKPIAIRFKSGVTIWFIAYSQRKMAIQSSTVHAVFTDEELPEDRLAELQARLNFSDGYFTQVFTATLNQDFWYRVMECEGEREIFPKAYKRTVSLYDCLFYEDNTPSEYWTEDKINEIKARCGSENEILRRVYGRFVNEEGVKYSAFDANIHFIPPTQIPANYSIYVGIDPGSGGAKNHPASIAFIAVNPTHTQGFIYKGWRGDNVETTASDIMDQFRLLRGKDKITIQVYDWSAKDFGIIASRIGEPFGRADKSRTLGEETLNTLFKNNALFIFDIPELQSLGSEFASLRHQTQKPNAKDDFIDSVRYAAVQVPWDWETLISKNIVEKPKPLILTPAQSALEQEIKYRRGELDGKKDDNSWRDFDDECTFWNEQYGNS